MAEDEIKLLLLELGLDEYLTIVSIQLPEVQDE